MAELTKEEIDQLFEDNAGQWTRLQKSIRSNRWSLAGGVIAFTDADHTEFLLDDFSVTLVGPVEGRREPAPFPQHLRRVDVGIITDSDCRAGSSAIGRAQARS